MAGGRRSALRPQQEDEPGDDERQREDLAHGEPVEGEVAEERIGLAEELDDDAGAAVTDEEDAAERAWPLANPRRALEDVDDEEEEGALEPGLIELARMARLRPAGREDHGPGHVADAAPELAVDEIGDAAEEEADRYGADDDVAEAEEIDAAL